MNLRATPAMFDGVNALVRLSLQLRHEMETGRGDNDRAGCLLTLKAIARHTDLLGARMNRQVQGELRAISVHVSKPQAVTAGIDLDHPDTPPTLRLTEGGGA